MVPEYLHHDYQSTAWLFQEKAQAATHVTLCAARKKHFHQFYEVPSLWCTEPAGNFPTHLLLEGWLQLVQEFDMSVLELHC